MTQTNAVLMTVLSVDIVTEMAYLMFMTENEGMGNFWQQL